MKVFLTIIVLASVLFITDLAKAQFQVKLLDNVASAFASRPVSIYCRTSGEDNLLLFSWGYVKLPTSFAKYSVIHQDACLGALAIDNDINLISDYFKAMGVLVLTHEAYHLRRKFNNQNEAVTDCRAFHHYDYAIVMLGGEKEILDRLMPLAIKLHFIHIRKNPIYNLKKCKTPERYSIWMT